MTWCHWVCKLDFLSTVGFWFILLLSLHIGQKSKSIAQSEIYWPIVHCNEVFGFILQ